MSPAEKDKEPFELKDFTKDEKKYLNSLVPSFLAACYADDNDAAKGDKKDWVVENVYPKFLETFYQNSSLRPNASSLQVKLYRYLLNHRRKSQKALGSSGKNVLPKKPRNINALELFAKERKQEIREKIAEKRATPSDVSGEAAVLSNYKSSRDELWNSLDGDVQAEYERKALDFNEEVGQGPTDQVIYKNQEQIVPHTMSALRNLIGRNWQSHGEVVFFVMGAYRTQEGKTRHFSGSVGNDADLKGFDRSFPDFRNVVQLPFKRWSADVLNRDRSVEAEDKATNPPVKAEVSWTSNEFPKLSNFEPEDVGPKDARRLLRNFINAAWEYGAPSSSKRAVPWNLLNAVNRITILQNSLPFNRIQSLDPDSASIDDIYGALEMILIEQRLGRQPLRFKTHRNMPDVALQADGPSTPSRKTANHNNDDNRQRSQLKFAELDFSPRIPTGYTDVRHQSQSRQSTPQVAAPSKGDSQDSDASRASETPAAGSTAAEEISIIESIGGLAGRKRKPAPLDEAVTKDGDLPAKKTRGKPSSPNKSNVRHAKTSNHVGPPTRTSSRRVALPSNLPTLIVK